MPDQLLIKTIKNEALDYRTRAEALKILFIIRLEKFKRNYRSN